MTFEELGTILRTEREKRGYSLDDVASTLKISVRVIRALEEGDESSLPHAVYVRGFVRSYGRYLELDAQTMEAALSVVNDDEPEAPSAVYTVPRAPSKSRGTLLMGLVLAVCFAAAAFFWMYRDSDLFSDSQQARLTSAIPAPSASPEPTAVSVKTPSPDAASTAARSSEKTEKTPAAAGKKTQTEQTPASVPPVSTPAGTPSRPAAGTAPAPAGATPASAQAQRTQPNGQHKIIITALSECWIHSSADSTDTRQFSLRKGDTFALTFADKLVLKLGNAGGVRIRYDGADLPAPGNEGQVKTLTFPPSE